jgi:sortase A
VRRISIAGWLECALLGLGAALIGYCSYRLAEARIFESRQLRRLERAAASPARSFRPLPRAHEVIGRLEAPRLHLSTLVLEGDQASDLRLGAGHIPGTSLPGDAGNVGIAAHRDTFFRSLRNVVRDDEIVLTTAGHAYRYRVTSTEIVSPAAVSVLRSQGLPELTLVTCYPFRYIGPAPRRFIVHARLVG